jgi:hypothetical protein
MFAFSCALPKNWTAEELREISQVQVFSINTEPKEGYKLLGNVSVEMRREAPLVAQVLAIPTFGLSFLVPGMLTLPNNPELLRRIQLKAVELGGNGVINYTSTINAFSDIGYSSGDVVLYDFQQIK